MYCILVTGIPAGGKSTMARFLGEELGVPVFSKDRIKELLFDEIGFHSRKEKVKLGTAAMNIMYDTAERLMQCGKLFILENNFENASRDKLLLLLEQYGYTAITVRLTGDYRKIYLRFAERNSSPDRHRGHVVNDCYPEREGCERRETPLLSFDDYVSGIIHRGMDQFMANGPVIIVDTTDFSKVDRKEIVKQIREYIAGKEEGE